MTSHTSVGEVCEGGCRKAAFKVGFLVKLAELGVMPTEFKNLMEKAALDLPGKLVEGLLSGAGSVGSSAISGGAEALKSIGGYGLQAAALAPFAVGGLSGAVEAGLEAPTPMDIENLRQYELLQLYERLTKEVSARRERKAALS